ncbi:endolytic transglycosylase MltG [Chamaesiphon polymorphus]|uniref:Endolytic murein transglycosylase n=1 Tax=Chamaesiphon polymorphus CCALA 037 TaxID=2107692 RepID=A0A2T1F6B0_9CYAN|nr:endolytic transglycosylase MltG [Chamaesiphon polymorphus]PSB40530.1 endolytic transglycosylase MltG [Chamaesiphon polymorphus CCALA 037]
MKSRTGELPLKLVQTTPKWLLISTPIALLALLAGGGTLWWNSVSAPASGDPNAQTIQIQVKPGASAQAIGQELEAKGVIKSQLAWKLWTNWQARQGKGSPQKGTYEIAPNQPLTAVAAQILEGKVIQSGFTIREGWNIKQMGEYFEKQGLFKAADFVAVAYKVPAETITPEGVVTQMLKQFEQVALPEYQKAAATNKLTLLEWVSLSSIVEKEAVVAEERARIAGVFTTRLAKNMRLESDPTVEYGLGIKQTADRPLTFAEVKRPNPYNTYMNAGIPPGPIASPGIGSLKAVLNPDSTDLLFFVAKYDGTHIFSKTLSEHVAATQAIRRQRQAGQK